jgi:GT2 family glycosyltransferase
VTVRPVHVIIVAFHGAEELERCLASVGRVEVTVVDNSSSRSVREAAAARGVRYIDTAANRGFAAGVNVGLASLNATDPIDVLLLNPDATIAPEDVEVLSAFLAEHERVAAVAPRLVDYDEVEQRVEWPFPNPLRMWLEALGLGRLSTRGSGSFVIGAVLLLRWEAIQEVGPFDERFFLYAEEADWQRRAAARRWTSARCPDAVARHRGSGSSASERQREVLFHAGHETYIRKWYGAPGWWIYRVAAISGAIIRTLVLIGERRGAAARRSLLYLRGPRRSAGFRVD